MGLDVTLCKHPDYAAYKRYEERKEKAHNKIHTECSLDGKKKLDDGEYDKYRKACDKWDEEHPPKPNEVDPVRIENNSKVYPDHMYKIGYLRSSYNDGGINSVLRNTIDLDLYYIFHVPGRGPEGDYHIAVDWDASLARAIDVRDRFAKYCEENGGYSVRRIALNVLSPPNAIVKDERDAMRVFNENMSKHKKRLAEIAAKGEKPNPHWDTGNYSNIHGDFHLTEPMRVVAHITGIEENVIAKLKGAGNAMMPCTYAIYEGFKEKPEDRHYEWYQRALEITVELCEFVIAQPDRDQYRLAWSG